MTKSNVNVKKMMNMLSLKKLQKKLMFLLKPKNLRKVLILVSVLALLYVIRQRFLAKEGFESTPDELEQTISGKKALVLFHAEWCGHCKKLMPEWDKASEEVKAMENENVMLVKVECGDPKKDETHADAMNKYNIKGYPTIISFDESGQHSEYNGKRSKSGMLSFLGLDGSSSGQEGMKGRKKNIEKKSVESKDKPKDGDNFEYNMEMKNALKTILEGSNLNS
tara:strand:- start:611 stop:1279 length:669 start_codon:yes stop_codon:yes gene_type:complete